MKIIIFSFEIFLIVQSFSQFPINPTDSQCSWIKNYTDIQDLAHHKYLILEDCLYYNLSQEADQETSKSSSLVLLPPTKSAGDKVVLNIQKTTLRQMWMNELWHDMTINGYMHVSWNDYRLKWKPSTWKIDTLNIKTYGHIWVPDVNSEKYQTASQSNDFVMFQDIKATYLGNLSARLEYRMQGQCETDYNNYPLDVSYCCVEFKSFLFDKLIMFKVMDDHGHLDEEQTQSNWDIKQFTVESHSHDGDNQVQHLSICLKAHRLSTTLRIELMVPMAVSTVIVVISPLFGTMLVQLYVKMFAILLQFLCFQFLVNRTPQAGLGNAIPKIYLYYEFTVAMTLTSLLITVLLHALSRSERTMPPPHRLMLFAAAFNNHFCCGGSRSGDSPDSNSDPSSTTSYRKDWKELFAAVNNLISFVILIIYILGAIILNA